MTVALFDDREDAGWLLAERLKQIQLMDPLVLAIPRGGIEVAAPLARSLGAELDVVLSRKIRAPGQPELALGAVSETGDLYLNHRATAVTEAGSDYIERERRFQLEEIERRSKLFRAVRPQAPVEGRSVIITDDGIATGSTMIAALRTVRAGKPAEITVAVPVGSSARLASIRDLCDRVVCLHEPETFLAIGQFYHNFDQVPDDRVLELLREYGSPKARTRTAPGTAPDVTSAARV
jgi:putative phosphoribosyl transferase